jgi:hypothetical protein
MAPLYVLLASQESSYVTGEVRIGYIAELEMIDRNISSAETSSTSTGIVSVNEVGQSSKFSVMLGPSELVSPINYFLSYVKLVIEG